jgi:hypothetical protein
MAKKKSTDTNSLVRCSNVDITMPSNPKHAIDIARPAMDLQNSSKSLLSLQFCRKSLIKHIYTRMVDREHESG